MAPVRPKPGGSPAKTPGSPAKETGSGAKDSGKVSKENPSANWAFSMGYDDPAQKPAFSGAAPRGGLFGDRSTLSAVSDNRKKKPRSYRVGCCGEGIGSMAEVADGAIKASCPALCWLVPAIHEGPAHRRRQARKALRPSAFLPVAPRRDSFLRRPGVDGRDKPGHDGKGSTNEQQTGRPTDNAIRAKIRALIALAVVGKESGAWRRWRTAPSRRHGRACPGHPRRPSASTQASAKSLATVRLPARRAEAGLVLAAALRGWPGQARP